MLHLQIGNRRFVFVCYIVLFGGMESKRFEFVVESIFIVKSVLSGGDNFLFS